MLDAALRPFVKLIRWGVIPDVHIEAGITLGFMIGFLAGVIAVSLAR